MNQDLSAQISELQVHVIACRLLLSVLLEELPDEKMRMLERIAQSSPDLALGFQFSDRQISQLGEQLSLALQSAKSSRRE